MSAKKTIGILGGMGPEATNKLCEQILSLTPAEKDQDHIPVIVHNNPRIPDRTGAILYGGENPVPEMVRTAQQLEAIGADFLIMPCNTAHYFIEDIQKEINIPLLNMIDETVTFVQEHYPDTKKIGLLATTGTVKAGVYKQPFKKWEIDVIVPSDGIQNSLVMEAIYGEQGIKAKHKTKPRNLLEKAALQLIKKGADVIIAGCTEIPLVLKQQQLNFVILDPSRILAEAAVRVALNDTYKSYALNPKIEVKA